VSCYAESPDNPWDDVKRTGLRLAQLILLSDNVPTLEDIKEDDFFKTDLPRGALDMNKHLLTLTLDHKKSKAIGILLADARTSARNDVRGTRPRDAAPCVVATGPSKRRKCSSCPILMTADSSD
jgi:hypothetical protein